MSNVFVKIGHGVEVGVEDVIKEAGKILSVGGKVIRVIHDVEAMTPQFKDELKQLIDDVKPIAIVLAPVVAAGGKNPIADFAAVEPVIADVIKLVRDFLSFLPALEGALAKLGEDLKN